MEPCLLTASAASSLIKERKLSSEELVRSCLARINLRDAQVRAWLHLDPDLAIRCARELDKLPPKGVLHGLPLGVKDVIDTADYPTTQNSPIYPALRVGRDAACVALARGSGALIFGKTDTVEFASSGRKALSRNPFNLAHTPGGSSSGSGAAVGDFMVPLALGTQTGGSLIRPAAFNGIYGMKPSWNMVSREGLRMSSATLDTVGWYGRCVEDLALMAEAFRISSVTQEIEIRGLRVGLCRSPAWSEIEPAGVAALEDAAKNLAAEGASVHELVLPAPFDRLIEAHAAIYHREGGASFMPEYVNSYDLLAKDLRAKVENTENVSNEKLLQSYAVADACRPVFDAMFGSELDVVLTPSAPGEAPLGLHTTGSSIFNRIWTLLHVPCVAVPVGLGSTRLPVGIQLVGPRMSDARLLAIAKIVAPIIDREPSAGLRLLF